MLNDSTQPIAPALYQETLERLDLQSICLDRVEAICDRENFDQIEITLHLNLEADETQDAAYYSICGRYLLEGHIGEVVCLSIGATYRLLFRSTEPVPSGFFEVFRDLNLRMLTMPYFRELVTSVTGRMELPTLIIPLNIFPASQDDEAAPEKVKPSRKRASRKKADKEGV